MSPAHVNDLMPTWLELSGASYPKPIRRISHSIEGSSILPLAQGKKQSLDKQIYWEHQGTKQLE